MSLKKYGKKLRQVLFIQCSFKKQINGRKARLDSIRKVNFAGTVQMAAFDNKRLIFILGRDKNLVPG